MTRIGTATMLAAALGATVLHPVPSGAGAGFVIVVNAANPLDRHGRADISKLFLRRTTAWPNGVPAAPCDLSSTSPVRRAFSEAVHNKPAWVVLAFWQEEIASGRSAPPRVCQDDARALQAVREDAGGIAYVAEGTPLGPGLKALAIAP
jgi:hypothetical protein